MDAKTITTFIFLLLMSSTVFAGRGAITDDNLLYQKVTAEIQKDLEGIPSCFRGKMKAKFEYMQENYGGRFSDSYDLDMLKIMETIFRKPAKYCSEILDRDLRTLGEDAPENEFVYRRCVNTDLSTSIAGITFNASTSGTFETEGLIFNIRYDVTNDLIVNYDAPYFPEDSEIKSWKVTEELECTIVE